MENAVAEKPEVETSEPKAVETQSPANQAELEAEASKKARKAPERFTCTKRDKAVLKLVDKLGAVTPQCNEAEEKYRAQQALANQAKKAWEAFQEQMQAICTQIASVQNGADYQPDLFDTATGAAAGIKAPHPDVHQEGKAAAPADAGGVLDLNCLTTKELVRLCGPEWSEFGLTPSKVEIVKSACEGDTIAALERMQRDNPHWNRDIKGFGEKWIDKLQDAHSAIRTKFPMPTSESAVESDLAVAEVMEAEVSAVAEGDDQTGTVLDDATEGK